MANDRLEIWRPTCMAVEALSMDAAEPWEPVMPWCIGVVYLTMLTLRKAACSSKAEYDGNR